MFRPADVDPLISPFLEFLCVYPLLKPKVIHNKMSESNIKVCCRFRPRNTLEIKEDSENSKKSLEYDNSSVNVIHDGIHKYNFDRIFGEKSTQEEVFNETALPVIEDMLKGYNCTIFVFGQTGCVDPNTLVLMYNGLVKKAKEVVIGDILMGDDSTPRKVLKLFSGEDDMYDIIPMKGDSYRVNKDHILTLKYTGKPNDKLIDIKVSDYLQQSMTWKRMHKGIRCGVSYPDKNLILDPYIFGLWLYSSVDREISSKGSTPFLNLIKIKNIPFEYLINSRYNRLKLLAGIIDGDGTRDKNCYDVVHKREILLDQIIVLSRSLGFSAYKCVCVKTCTNVTYYRCCISGKTHEIPVLLYRKKCKVQHKDTDVLSTGIKLVSAGRGLYNGFMLDRNHRFLLGDFTVTHNSGKTYSMSGVPEDPGITPRIVERIFNHINDSPDTDFTVCVSYIEIYLEKIRDLLNTTEDNLKLREGGYREGIWIQGVTEDYVSSYEDVFEILKQGNRNRSVAETRMNQRSSRSHSVFLLTLTQVNTVNNTKISSKLVLVDLAGSEKVGKTGATGLVLKQAQHTNKSLSCLGLVIRSLTEKSSHIPYRDSKLTRILTDSLGGNSKTCLMVACSPSQYNIEETLSTLRFGSQVKTIKNIVHRNIEKSVDEYKRLLEEAHKTIEMLKKRGVVDNSYEYHKEEVKMLEEKLFEKEQEIQDLSDNFQVKISEKENEIFLLTEEYVDKLTQKEKDIHEKITSIERLRCELLSKSNEISLFPSSIEYSGPSKNYLNKIIESRQDMINVLEVSLCNSDETIKNQRNDYESTIRALKNHIQELQKIVYFPGVNNKRRNVIVHVNKIKKID
jgi:hypothetical protein